MLADRFFYPLAVIIVAGIVAFALSLGGANDLSDQEIIESGWSMSSQDLNALTISPGSNGRFINEEGGFIRLSQFVPDGQGPQSIGVFATLGPAHERAFAGRLLRLTIRARAGQTFPLDVFESAYFPMEANPSRWSKFELSEEWQDYSYEFTPPIVDAPDNVDLIAIFPGRLGENKEVDVAEIRIDVLQADASD